MTELAADIDTVTMMHACRWVGAPPLAAYYYQPTKARPRINEHLAAWVKRAITDLPYTGYRTVVWLLGENKNTIQRLFQIKGCQVRKRRSGGPTTGAGFTFGGPLVRMSAVQRTLHASRVALTAGAP